MKKIVFDIEGDGFNPTKFHVVSFWEPTGSIDLGEPWDHEGTRAITKVSEMKELFSHTGYFIGHNISRFDVPAVHRILGVDINPQSFWIDTLPISWYLYPYLIRHGLEHWGERLGYAKPEITDWENLPVDIYCDRCSDDVWINKLLWEKMWKKLMALYDGNGDKCTVVSKYLTFKLQTVQRAIDNGWKLDIAKAEENKATLEGFKDERVEALAAVMPDTPKMKKMNHPKNKYKKDGTLTVVGEKWTRLCESLGVDESAAESIEFQDGWNPPKPTSDEQKKAWLFSLGWKPTWYKDGANGPVPQITKDGYICPDIERLAEVHPAVLELKDLGVLVHRIGLLKGFLNTVDEDGLLHADCKGFTNTLRLKHRKPLVNLPSVDAKYGEYIRSCLISKYGRILGADLESLEDRTKRHWMYPYDPAYVEAMSKPGYDPHLDLALFNGDVTQEDIDKYVNGEDHDGTITKLRKNYKVVNYSATYGAGAARIAEEGIELKKAEELHTAYWERNKAIKDIADDTFVKTYQPEKKDKKELWLLNPINGFYYELRSFKDKFSTLNQSTGAYIFDMWLHYMLRHEAYDPDKMQLLGQFHDELALDLAPDVDEALVEQILRESIEAINKKLNLNVQMNCSSKVGKSYSEVH